MEQGIETYTVKTNDWHMRLPVNIFQRYAGMTVIMMKLPGSGDCIALYTEKQFDRLEKKILKKPRAPKYLSNKKSILECVYEITISETNNRITMPPLLAKYAGIGTQDEVAIFHDGKNVWFKQKK